MSTLSPERKLSDGDHELTATAQNLTLDSDTEALPPPQREPGSQEVQLNHELRAVPSTSQDALSRERAPNNEPTPDDIELRADIWFLKTVDFESRPVRIVTQNFNGPCSFIAICNILILRGDIQISPPHRPHVSYEYLSQLVADYLLTASPDVDISAALTKMPVTREGMDLNPLFTGVSLFRPAGDGGELQLFEQANIRLFHGWVVDPDSSEYDVLSRAGDYDTAVNMIVAGDDASRGQLVVEEESYAGPSSSAGPSRSGPSHLSSKDQKKIEDALIIRQFLDTTKTQLTYHGLFSLASTMKTGSLVALFRNSHLSVLYKAAPSSRVPQAPNTNVSAEHVDVDQAPQTAEANVEDPADAALYLLVTDYAFLHEPSVVWERLEDVDGGSSTFVDSELRRSSPAGGDWAGHTAESALAAYEAEMGIHAIVDPADRALAQQLQAEEDAHAQQEYARRQQERQAQAALAQRQRKQPRTDSENAEGKKSKKDCVIM